MTPKDIREWTDRNGRVVAHLIPYVDQVCSALGIDKELREPPIAKELGNGLVDGACIPAVPFPSWMRCPNPQCGSLYCKPWRNQSEGMPRCGKCDKAPELEQVSWVFVHPDGHMSDVPWHRLTHSRPVTQGQRQCRMDWNESYIRLINRQGSRYELFCERCQLTSDFKLPIMRSYGQLRRQPWIWEGVDNTISDSEHQDKQIPESELAQVLDINDTRIHSPVNLNALVIPPESRIRRGTVVDRLYVNSYRRREIDRNMNPLQKKSLLGRLADEFQCTKAEVDEAIMEIKSGYPLYGRHTTPGLLLETEYQALIQPIPNLFDDEDFVTKHHTKGWKDLGKNLKKDSRHVGIVNVIGRLIAVDRLKEILVLNGFQRLGGELVPPDITGEESWLPALELYGEGVFFTLEENILQTWEKIPPVLSRILPIQRRFKRSGRSFEPSISVTPRFVLLHTLAHILIRQLEAESGYPAASLKERIYSKSGKNPMAGILVYVAVPDVEGSLGGLSELADPLRFLKLIINVFDHADWCSLDPVCSEHEGQGPDFLNLAACHACTLIPEPSCAYGNILLDRGIIKGDKSQSTDSMPGFLDLAPNPGTGLTPFQVP